MLKLFLFVFLINLLDYVNLSKSLLNSKLINSDQDINDAHFSYDLFDSHNLKRNKRENDHKNQFYMASSLESENTTSNRFPLSSEFPAFPYEYTKNSQSIKENTNNKNYTIKEENYSYYNATFMPNNISETNKYWYKMEEVKNSLKHEMLSNAHRRAATIHLLFKFPFYGHKIEDITIATGGFLFLGEAIHTWLAATQYIAPLMANFNTSISKNSNIYYAMDNHTFTVQWDKVYLQEVTGNISSADNKDIRNPIHEPFSFQVTLKDNGDIIFVYKEIPFNISKINEDKHPVKVGISDAYIIDRAILFIRRKTIYEYHKAELKRENIVNNTVIYFKALPTCNSMSNCTSCLNEKINFDCQWCETLKRCSDGFDRHRQNWIKNGCEENSTGDVKKCSKPAPLNIHTGEISTTPNQKLSNSSVLNLNINKNSFPDSLQILNKYMTPKDGSKSRKSSFTSISIMITILLVAFLVYWAMYAYSNPQSRAGQFLIKYRPAQWRMPNSETRYATEFDNI